MNNVPMKNISNYKKAIYLTIVTALILIWISMGVGVIGRDGQPLNLVYFGVIAIGVIVATFGRFQPHGMVKALYATAIAQSAVTVVAIILEWGYPYSKALELLGINGFFIALWVGSAILFRASQE